MRPLGSGRPLVSNVSVVVDFELHPKERLDAVLSMIRLWPGVPSQPVMPFRLEALDGGVRAGETADACPAVTKPGPRLPAVEE